jgi:amino acid transporter
MTTDSAFPSIAYPLSFNKIKYLDLTNQLNNYNEIYNMNQYVSNVNKSELDKISSFNESLKTKVLKLKQDYLLKDFAVYNYAFWANIMYFTIIASGVALAIIAFYNQNSESETAILSKRLTIIIIVALSLIYLVSIFIAFSAKVIRRKYAWNQFYWKQK